MNPKQEQKQAIIQELIEAWTTEPYKWRFTATKKTVGLDEWYSSNINYVSADYLLRRVSVVHKDIVFTTRKRELFRKFKLLRQSLFEREQRDQEQLYWIEENKNGDIGNQGWITYGEALYDHRDSLRYHHGPHHDFPYTLVEFEGSPNLQPSESVRQCARSIGVELIYAVDQVESYWYLGRKKCP